MPAASGGSCRTIPGTAARTNWRSKTWPQPSVCSDYESVIFVNAEGRMTAVAIRSSARAVCVL